MTCDAKVDHDENGNPVFACQRCNVFWHEGDESKCRHGKACDVCQGQAGAVTVGKYALCHDPRCADVAKAWLERQPDGSTYWEGEAIKAGGRAGGKYLETLGRFTLSQLTPDEYQTYAKTIVTTYRNELRRLAAMSAPPF